MYSVSKTAGIWYSAKIDSALTRDHINTLPFASMRAHTRGGSEALLGLIRDDGELHWLSGDGKVITSLKGRLLKTAGLKYDLLHYRSESQDPVVGGLLQVSADTRYVRRWLYTTGSGPLTQTAEVALHSRFVRHGVETVTIVGQSFELLQVDEFLRAPEIGFKATNRFWIDPAGGYIWKSEQYYHPALPPLTLEVTLPYTGDMPPAIAKSDIGAMQ